MTDSNDRPYGKIRFDQDAGTYHVTYDWDREEPISTAVTHAVAEIEQTDPDRIPSLSEVVSPDALDALFKPKLDGSPRANGYVSFAYAGYHVTVHNEGEIELDPDADEPHLDN